MILISVLTASASEIVVAALRDNGRATLFGARKSRCDFNPEWSQLNQDFNPKVSPGVIYFNPKWSQLNQDFNPKVSPGVILTRNGHNLTRIFIPKGT